MTRNRGFSLIELMIAIAIIAIIAAVAIPAYRGYIRESRLGAVRMNLDSLRIAVEAFRLDRASGNYGPTATYTQSKTVKDIEGYFGWRPEGDNDVYVYTVSAVSAATPTYSIIATRTDISGLYARCDKTAAAFKCCASASACP
jgi:type IV pilus assembly protein PilE